MPSYYQKHTQPLYHLKKSFTAKILETIKIVLLLCLFILSLILLYYSATKSFYSKDRLPQAIAVSTSMPSSYSQASLFFQIANEAYAEGDYEKARHFLYQAKERYPHLPNLNALSKATEEASTLQKTYLENIKNKKEETKREEMIQDRLQKAEQLIHTKEWDQATIVYQEVLLIDPHNEESKQGILNIEKLRPSASKISKSRKPETIKLYQMIETLLAQAKNHHEKEEYLLAIKAYQKAFSLAKKYDFETQEILDYLEKVEEEFNDRIYALWSEAEALFLGRRYDKAKEKIELLLAIQPSHKLALEKRRELRMLLIKQAQMLYAQSIILEAMPDIEGAKIKWENILPLISPHHEYYKKAQKKLQRYVSF